MKSHWIDNEWKVIRSLLPEGWEDLAREKGALRRARGVNAETLLRLILMHAAGGLSLRSTVLRAQQWKMAKISDVALFKRLRGSESWLRSINTRLLKDSRFCASLDEVPAKWRMRAIDATSVMEPGATGTSFRIHYSLKLPDLYCDFFELTTDKGAEDFDRFPVSQGDVLLADRGYNH